ncbi:hypothetical protein RhiirA4_544091 [Rhizophagus irregularis]|uniref:Uncharacterized protein n=1 Tax=Rhizophagus irregularis TaxID=588596 RepID=A0A2I1GLV7_9GLOM|nr:hypothetical protein RhiirA4_544091 [Rhizophagus irregularis]
MRRRASSEGRVFVRQNLEKGQLIVDDTGFNAKRYSHSKVLRYDEGLRGTIQYWIHRKAELDKWQHHGSSCSWRKEASGVDWENMKNNDEIRFFSYNNHPDLNAPPSDHHPCQKHSEDFNDNNGYLTYLELTTTRNDPLINPHDHIQLQGWRANVDLIPILTKQYVSKYASEENHGP